MAVDTAEGKAVKGAHQHHQQAPIISRTYLQFRLVYGKADTPPVNIRD